MISIYFVNLRLNNRFITMSRVTIKDKTFEISIPETTILEKVKSVADRINKRYGWQESPISSSSQWLVYVCCRFDEVY